MKNAEDGYGMSKGASLLAPPKLATLLFGSGLQPATRVAPTNVGSTKDGSFSARPESRPHS